MSRAQRTVDYWRLHDGNNTTISSEGLTVLPPDFRGLHRELLQHSDYRSGGARRLPARQLTPDWLRQNGAFRPVLVPASATAAQDTGLRLPPAGTFTPERLAGKLGPASEVATVDTQTQGDGPRWTLHQWSLYWDARRALSKDPAASATPRAADAHPTPGAGAAGVAKPAGQAAGAAAAAVEDEADSAAVTRRRPADDAAAAAQAAALEGISSESRRRLLEVAALPLTGTALEGEVAGPAAVAGVDLRGVWPADAPNRPAPGAFLAMAPEGAFADFALAPGGASFWLHMISGSKTFALIPPTPRNLATYAAWASGPRQAAVFLAAHCEGVLRVDVSAGDTLLVPGGWAYASATTAAATAVGGSYLRADSLAVQLDVWRIEERLGARPHERSPMFKMLHWYLAAQLATRLQALAGLSDAELQQKVAARLEAEAAAPPQEDEEGAAAAAAELHGNSGSVLAGSGHKRRRAEEEEEEGEEVTMGQRRPRPQQPQQPQAQRPQQPRPGAVAVGQRPGAAGRLVGRTPGKALGGQARPKPAAAAGGSATRLPGRLHPTQQRIDIGRAGGVRGSSGPGKRRRQREESPDSFVVGGGDEEELSDAEDEEQDWDPRKRRAVAAASDASDDALSEEELLEDELLLKEELQRSGWAEEDEIDGGRPRTRRRAAEVAALGPTPRARAWQPQQQAEELVGRKSTRFQGHMPPRLAAMLHEEEGDELEEEAEQQQQQQAYTPAAWQPAAAAAAAVPASPGAGLSRPLKLKVKLPPPGSHPTQSTAGTGPAAASPPAKVVLKLKPGSFGAAALNQQQQQQAADDQEEGGDECIPQVDGAGDELDPLQAMYAELYRQAEEGGEAEEEDAEEEGQQADPYVQWPLGQAAELVSAGAAPEADFVEPTPQPQVQQQAVAQVEHGHEGQPTSAAGAAADPSSVAPAPAADPRQDAPVEQAPVGFAARPVEPAPAAEVAQAAIATQGQGPSPASQAPAAAAAVPAASEPDGQPQQLAAAAPAMKAEPLSEEEQQGLAALVATLRRWLRAPSALNDVPLAIKQPKELVLSLEVCMLALGMSLQPPPPVNFNAVSAEQLLPAGGAVAGLDPEAAAGEQGGEFAPREEVEPGEPVVVEESTGPKHRLPAAAAGTVGGSGGRGGQLALQAPGAARRGAGKKLGVKGRLMKKLGL